MGKIVAFGGGGFGAKKPTLSADLIYQEIIHLSGKKKPQVLFIPTASFDSEKYIHSFVKKFNQDLGCLVDVLYLIKEKLIFDQVASKILKADIIYVGGGNTLMMMKLWRKLGIDQLLLQAHEKGIVLAGVSAGAICWFKAGNSDSRKFKNPAADYIQVRGLGLFNLLLCPHYDTEKNRKPSLKAMMKKVPGIAVALDDYCALEIIDDQYRIISARPGAHAYKVRWKRGIFYEEKLEQKLGFNSLALLFS